MAIRRMMPRLVLMVLPKQYSIPGSATVSVNLERLHKALLSAPSVDISPHQDGIVIDSETLTPAAVLLPIVLHPNAPSVLLTKRTAHLADHPGQISFPGGRVEAGDASRAHTALREAEEEIGLLSQQVSVVGYLPDYATVTGFRVTPVVAWVEPPLALRLDTFEVAEAFEVPLTFLLDPERHQRHSGWDHERGRQRHYDAIPYGDYFIWGATAGIILSLYRAMQKKDSG